MVIYGDTCAHTGVVQHNMHFPVGSSAAGLTIALFVSVLGAVVEGKYALSQFWTRLLRSETGAIWWRHTTLRRLWYCILCDTIPIAGVGVIYWTAMTPLNLLGVIVFEDCVFMCAFTSAILVWAVVNRDWAILRVSDDPAECTLFHIPGRDGRSRITLAQLVMCIGLLNTVR